jgi:uncharacterized protein YjiS (DUF1127 family)
MSSIFPLPVAFVALAAAGARRIGSLLVARRHRKSIMDLNGMDEHMLKDIGLSRGDVHAALDEPFYRDPTSRLASESDERRLDHRNRLRGRHAPPVKPVDPAQVSVARPIQYGEKTAAC